MKTKSLFVAIAMVIAVSSFGNEVPAGKGLAVVPVKGSEVIRVIYKNDVAGKVKLNIYNTSSELVFSETFYGTDGFIRPLNFNGLAAGEYTFEITDANGKKVEKVNYQPVKRTKYVHVSKVKESGKFLLAVSANGSEEVSLKIYDAANNLLHAESNAFNNGFAQVYSVEVQGPLTFEVSDKSGVIKTFEF